MAGRKTNVLEDYGAATASFESTRRIMLNLKDANGFASITLFPATGIATIENWPRRGTSNALLNPEHH
jgi:hypothetical protein